MRIIAVALRALALVILRVLVLGYRYLISPILPGACRYAPSCSEYAIDALNRHGPFAGGWLAAKRLARCHPWGGSGYDPVPPGGYTTHCNTCGCGTARQSQAHIHIQPARSDG